MKKVWYNNSIMEGKKSKPRALLVFGAPCSGKTAFAEKFAKKFDLAYYDFDDIKAKYRLTRKNILLITKLLAQTGKTFIIEGGLGTEKERGEMRNILRTAGYEPSLIWVQTDSATIRARMKMRYKSVEKAREAYNASVEDLEAPTELEHPIILSGKHTFETQTKHILAGLADADK
jgi:gluconate kinase